MGNFPVPLTRDPLVDAGSRLVSRPWVPWFDAWHRQLNALQDLVEVQAAQAPGTSAAAVEALRQELEVLLSTTETAVWAQKLVDAFDELAKGSATDGEPVAVNALQLQHKSGDFYQRFALAAT